MLSYLNWFTGAKHGKNFHMGQELVSILAPLFWRGLGLFLGGKCHRNWGKTFSLLLSDLISWAPGDCTGLWAAAGSLTWSPRCQSCLERPPVHAGVPGMCASCVKKVWTVTGCDRSEMLLLQWVYSVRLGSNTWDMLSCFKNKLAFIKNQTQLLLIRWNYQLFCLPEANKELRESQSCDLMVTVQNTSSDVPRWRTEERKSRYSAGLAQCLSK